MQPTVEKSNYPVFEANQVLSNRHLNQMFDHLDEQNRLTRANLIGIGIACGLEVSLGGTAAAPVVQIAKGCGVSSQGYLLVEPRDLQLVAYKKYATPLNVAYPLLQSTKDFTVWEMFEALEEPSAISFSDNPGFLNDKVVILFLELKKESLRNCSPTNCDDRGAEVTMQLRRLLVSKSNQQQVLLLLDGTLQINKKFTLDDYEKQLLLQLHLPDLRLPRYNVPAGPLLSSNVVLAGFFTAIRTANLAKQLGTALSAAYHAFSPVVRELYPTDPFIHFNDLDRYGFLNSAPDNVAQVRFLQYYYDLFDDLIKAYDEFRWKGAALMCACCPPDALFPRHLVLALAHPELDNGAAIYRHFFRASSAISGCEKHTGELQQLFRRLVVMTERFTNDPKLFQPPPPRPNERRIYVPPPPLLRITPSKLGDVPLSEKAIPYYYTQGGSPRLFQLWNAEKTQRQQAEQNLGYRTDEYATTDFARNPLRYDLEPYNFLRIEGHLDQPWQPTLQKLLDLRNQYRLPIDIIALRTGAFDASQLLEKDQGACHFEDLEVLYSATREQWLGQLCNEVTYLYHTAPVPIVSVQPDVTDHTTKQDQESTNNSRLIGHIPALTEAAASTTAEDAAKAVDFKSKYDLINDYAAGFLVKPDRIGGLYENNISIKDSLGINDAFFELFNAVFALVAVLPKTLQEFKYSSFKKQLNVMLNAAYKLELKRENPITTKKIADIDAVFLWEGIDDRLEGLRLGFRSEAFKSMYDEYLHRYQEVQQKKFLTNFLLTNPGIQHKAGVPLGGTFILIYHDDPPIIKHQWETTGTATYLDKEDTLLVSQDVLVQDKAYAARTGQPLTFTEEVAEAYAILQTDPIFALNPHFHTLVGALSGQVLDYHAHFDLLTNKDANEIIGQYVQGLPDGRIIADFFLPYRCCSDCGGVQYVLAYAPLTFTFTVGCTSNNDQADVAIVAQGGAPPYSYKVNTGTQGYQPLGGVVILGTGWHTLTLRDSQNTESTPQTFEIKGKVKLGAPDYTCRPDGKFYRVSCSVSGGTGSYTASRGKVTAKGFYTSDEIKSGTKANIPITITDGKGCSVTFKANHTCPAPLDFTVQPGCTDKDGQSASTITVTGGVPDYQIKVSDGQYQALTTPYLLPAGKPTITVRDSKNVEISQEVSIPEQLRATVDYKCLRGGTKYRATVTLSGGTQPYYLAGKTIPGDKFVTEPLGSALSTALTFTDDSGCVTTIHLQHTCIEERPLVVSPVQYRCEGTQYIASFQVAGGTPPYRVEGPGHIYPNGRFESGLLPGGDFGVQIFDKEGNLVTLRLRYECAPAPCDLPCGGLSRLCAYRLWLQPGTFRAYEAREVECTFTDEKGITQNIKELSVAVPPRLLNGDFRNTMRGLVAKVNAGLAKTLGEGRLTFSCEAREDDPFARLWIEYYQCEKFSLRFKYIYADQTGQHNYEAHYTNAGVTFTNLQTDERPVPITAFDCSTRDQCADTVFAKVCQEKMPAILLQAKVSGDQLSLTAAAEGKDQAVIAQWIWDIEHSVNGLYTSKEVVVNVPGLSKNGTTVRLTGISKQGCFATTVQKIPPRDGPPLDILPKKIPPRNLSPKNGPPKKTGPADME